MAKKAAKKKTTKKATRKRPAPKGRRPRWATPFIDHLRKSRSVSKSAKAVGIGRRTAYDLRNRDPKFLEEWEDAMLDAVEDLEASAFEKAKDGWLEPVYYQGQRVGVRNRFSPDLIMRMLAALRPEVYNRPRYDAAQAAANSGDASQPRYTSIVFVQDPDEVRRRAEERAAEEMKRLEAAAGGAGEDDE